MTEKEAREAGEAWAQREWDALEPQDQDAATEKWSSHYVDALPLIDDDDVRRGELADVANRAAAARWYEIVCDYIAACSLEVSDD